MSLSPCTVLLMNTDNELQLKMMMARSNRFHLFLKYARFCRFNSFACSTPNTWFNGHEKSIAIQANTKLKTRSTFTKPHMNACFCHRKKKKKKTFLSQFTFLLFFIIPRNILRLYLTIQIFFLLFFHTSQFYTSQF